MDFTSLHELLRSTYQEMLPLAGEMTGIAKGIAGLGALFYVALRVWSSLARAEPVDVYPLLRPFVLGFCIMFFPTVVLGTMNTVLSPVVQGTEAMVNKQEGQLAELTAKRDKLKEEAYLRNPETAYLVSNEKFDQKIEEMGIIGPSDGSRPRQVLTTEEEYYGQPDQTVFVDESIDAEAVNLDGDEPIEND